MVRLEQVGCHLRLIAFGDVIILGFVLLEDHAHFDDSDAGFEFLDDLRCYLIRGSGLVIRDRGIAVLLGVLVLLYLRTCYAVETNRLAIRKTHQDAGSVCELVVGVDVHRLDEQSGDILTALVLLAEGNLRFEVLVDRTVHMDKLTALSGTHRKY